jgi:ligand-binding SRPBCC domain-containing protein
MKILHFDTWVWLARPIDEIFPFFANALNLETLTPPWLHFQLVGSPPRMAVGTEIDYHLKIRGIPIRWRSRITTWNPPYHFVDEQIRGPYRLWIHEHRFRESGSGTRCEDHVSYSPPGGTVIDRLFVAKDIQKIFRFRSDCLHKLFGKANSSLEPLSGSVSTSSRGRNHFPS